MKNNPLAGKSTRTKIFTIITIVSVILLLALNIFLANFTVYGNAYIDLTPEGLYTLRDVMVDASKKILNDENGNPIDPGIKVTFCNDPDKLIDNSYTRVVYYMCIAMEKKFDNFTVETLNVTMDPTSVAQYKTTSLSVIEPTDVILSCGSRYSIVEAKSFWRIGSEKVISYDGEYKLASVMMSLTMVNRPVAYFVTDHGETYYDVNNLEGEGSVESAAFAGLLEEKGFRIKTLSLSGILSEAKANGTKPSIPDDCVLLIINNPRQDFNADKEGFNSLGYISETELLDRYMTEERGSIMVTKDYRVTLPNFEDFLSEWGIECTNYRVFDETNHLGDDKFVAEYDNDENGYGYAIYGDYAELSSAPITVVSDTGYVKSSFNDSTSNNEAGTHNTTRTYAPFLLTSSDAVYYGMDGGIAVNINKTKPLALAAVSGRQKLDDQTGNYDYSYLFCAASPSFFSSDLVGNSSYANADVLSALIHNIARLESYADESLGGLSINNKEAFLGKMLVDMELSEEDKTQYEWDESTSTQVLKKTIYGMSVVEKIIYTVIIALVPIAIMIVGIVVCVKRKYL